ncbi:MAG TPA: D-aminoacylase [Puia sp.]|nr:D-aminoacylase [Puia sp.]
MALSGNAYHVRNTFYRLLLIIFSSGLLLSACHPRKQADVVIRNGMIYDGLGGTPYRGDIAIQSDSILAIGDLREYRGKAEINAEGRAIAPGFINMLSQADVSLLYDGRSQSDIRQGVTLEVMGEGESMGPLNSRMKDQMVLAQKDIHFDVSWNTLGEYLQHLESKGVSCNVASFVGAAQVRDFVLGEDDRAPTAAELDSMKKLVDQAMEEGAMGVSSSLIYPPGFFARTDELIALCREASRYHGIYISHMRSEGNRLIEAVDELIKIAREANIPAEIFHLKAAGKDNWVKLDTVIAKVEAARKAGLAITADMYTYTAGATGLTSAFPPALQDGGFGKLWERLHDPAVRRKMIRAMDSSPDDWENLYSAAGSPDKVLLLSFRQDSLKKYNGRTLAEVAKMRGRSPEETAIDLILEDSTRIGVAYFLMSEENVRRQMALPWVSFGSDAASYTNEGVFLKSSAHPRAYGNFVRVLGKYSRDEKVIPLQEAIYKLAKLPSNNLKISRRGELKVGNYADVVIFDPAKVSDRATYSQPHQYATGITDVFVNGVQVLKNGEHTGAKPGRFIHGPGWTGSR